MPEQRFAQVAGGRCRIWEKGTGKRIGVVPGLRGFPAWTPFLEGLARDHRVVVVSPPGFYGSDDNHEVLDSHLDWLSATLDLLEAAGLAGAPLVAASVGAILAADVAALAPGFVPKLSLTAPYGLYDSAAPVTDVFAQTPQQFDALLSADATAYGAAFAGPEDDDAAAADHGLRTYRTNVAAARLSWPFGDRGLRKRLHRITAPTQLIWGDADRVVPPSYGVALRAGLSGPCELTTIAGAGHLAWVDRPEACAAAIASFLRG